MKKFAYMIVTHDGHPILLDAKLPIYWLKMIAERDAKERAGGARVVRIDMPRALSH